MSTPESGPIGPVEAEAISAEMAGDGLQGDQDLTAAQIEQRRQARTVHGTHSYLARTEKGALVTSDMALVESAIIQRHAEAGPRGMVEAGALRFETAAAIAWGAAQGAETHDQRVSLLKLWGWLQGCAIRGWRDWAAMKAIDQGEGDPGRILEQVKREQTR